MGKSAVAALTLYVGMKQMYRLANLAHQAYLPARLPESLPASLACRRQLPLVLQSLHLRQRTRGLHCLRRDIAHAMTV